jgi:hypothetical protein
MDGRFLLTGVVGKGVLSRETAGITVDAVVTSPFLLLITEAAKGLSGIVNKDDTLRKKNSLAIVENDVTRLPETDREDTLLLDSAVLFVFVLILFLRRFSTRREPSLLRD